MPDTLPARRANAELPAGSAAPAIPEVKERTAVARPVVASARKRLAATNWRSPGGVTGLYGPEIRTDDGFRTMAVAFLHDDMQGVSIRCFHPAVDAQCLANARDQE